MSVRGLGKSYRLEHKHRYSSFSEALVHRLRSPFGKSDFETMWALQDISFDISQGDVVGIVGRNGAGKSTLFKILSRITQPTTGEITIRGRIASLIEVGTGFQPELTGRENIFLNGAILGMRRAAIRSRFDEIVDFSVVERFLDTPVKRYSSGMYVRLAFAVAAHLDADILLVDEVLSVGDADFQKKCLGKMQSVASSGRTVFLVSHDTQSIEKLCRKGLFLSAGRLADVGNIDAVLGSYRRSMRAQSNEGALRPIALENHQHFIEFDLVDENGASIREVDLGKCLRFQIRAKFPDAVQRPLFMIFIDSSYGQRMLNIISPKSEQAIRAVSGDCQISCSIDRILLAPGDYSVRIAITAEGGTLDDTAHLINFTVNNADPFGNGWGGGKAACVANSQWVVRVN